MTLHLMSGWIPEKHARSPWAVFSTLSLPSADYTPVAHCHLLPPVMA